jgi:hypothetical protein
MFNLKIDRVATSVRRSNQSHSRNAPNSNKSAIVICYNDVTTHFIPDWTVRNHEQSRFFTGIEDRIGPGDKLEL